MKLLFRAKRGENFLIKPLFHAKRGENFLKEPVTKPGTRGRPVPRTEVAGHQVRGRSAEGAEEKEQEKDTRLKSYNPNAKVREPAFSLNPNTEVAANSSRSIKQGTSHVRLLTLLFFFEPPSFSATHA